MFLFIVLLIIQIVSAGLCALAVWRLYAYINQYKFDESVYTLLFGFVRIRYFVWIYVLMVLAAAALGVSLAFSSISL